MVNHFQSFESFMKCFSVWVLGLLASGMGWAQTSFTEPTRVFLMHSSGNHLEAGSDDGGWIEASTKGSPQQMTLVPDGQGYYTVQVADEPRFLSLAGQWNSKFVGSSSGDETKWAIEPGMSEFVKLRCKANGRYLGTDSNDAHSKVFTDKNGADMKHLWYFSQREEDAPDRHAQLHGQSAAGAPAVRRLGCVALLVGWTVWQVDGPQNRRDCHVAGQSDGA